LGLSQAKFSKRIPIANGYIANIELEKREPNERIIKLACATYNINEHWLRTGEGEMFNNSPNPVLDDVIKTFQGLRPEFQEFVLGQVDRLLELQYRIEVGKD